MTGALKNDIMAMADGQRSEAISGFLAIRMRLQQFVIRLRLLQNWELAISPCMLFQLRIGKDPKQK
jgi:hypothetical protein